MHSSKKGKFGAVVLTIVLLGSMSVLPMSGAVNIKNDIIMPIGYPDAEDKGDPIRLDTYYTPEEEVTAAASEYGDIGYNIDVGNNIVKSLPVYVGEPVEEGVPGRGRTGTLDSSSDDQDWYAFSVCEGQTISVSLTTSEDFNYELSNAIGEPVGHSYTADITGIYFIKIFANSGAGEYTFGISLGGQNDAGTGNDAGDNIGSATSISEGEYSGYMSSDDVEDWYSFSANTGEGIFVTVDPYEKSDFDIHLYNPSGELVHSALYYGEDELEYPADASGTWKIQLDMFPGWDTSKWPDNYFLYGSGAYDLTLNIGGSAQAPPAPIPQEDITPVAQTFIINDDPTSNKDEYGYLAAIPAANYLDGGERYLSPIVYQGVDLVPTWHTTVDQTTQYLIDDWNTYLSRNGMTATDYNIPADPVQAAAQIAEDRWTSSSTAVVTVDGSAFEDEIKSIFDEDATLTSNPETTAVRPGEFKDIGGYSVKPMFIWKQWGAIHMVGRGSGFSGDTGVITPRFEGIMEDWWPHPYDFNGDDFDTFFPITKPGIWLPYVTSEGGLEELQINLYPGHRYELPVTTTDCSIEVTIETDTPSNLLVYLVDPEGNVRAPRMDHYNGGEIKPIHRWNGGHWEHDYEEFRTWIIDLHDDYTVKIHHPMVGTWTAIVVPYLNYDTGDASFNGGYHISANIREYNPDRIAATKSAANAAVIASSKHAPLLYVTADSVPSETSDALSQLGVSNIIFVNIDEVSSASLSGSVTEYKTMQQVIDAIKADSNSENFITIASIGSGEGYFAPAAMAAAYHVGPVLDVGDAPNAVDVMGKVATWREYGGDFYHGCRSLGHLPDHGSPLDIEGIDSWLDIIIYYFTHDQEFPPIGFDLKLTWMSAITKGITDMIKGYDLDLPGKEAYLFVSDREQDIRDVICRSMMGNESFAGHIPVPTTAFSTALICRDLLYPAIIYANPGRDVTTSQLMNFPDGRQWTTNDGSRHSVYSSRELKRSFSSHGRFYEGHALWDNLIERYNTGASLCYYSGHGTGGSGISAQYRNVEEDFPLNEIKHEHMRDYEWPDAWRGYMYDDTQTKTVRWGGFTWYNAKEPNLYDIIHFKHVDELFENLHSIWDLWMSCTTQAHYGPIVYLSHGGALCFGNAGTGLCPQADLLDDNWIRDVCENGKSIGEALSTYWWLHQRDYTTLDPTTLYGSSAMQVTNMQVIFGDPTMTVYSPEWTEPVPVLP